MTNWAVVVGINHYDHLSSQEQLKFAASDAERVKQFLCERAGFREDFVVLCTDTSPSVAGLSTRPNRSNLRRILRTVSHDPQAKGADQAWFFFSGHGLQSANHQNYMLTCDGVPDDLEETALSVDFVIQQLIHCEAKNTVLVLDMCRNEVASGSKGSDSANEAQIARQAQQHGIITIFSCSRGGKSYELPDLQQGVFTYAFLEGLQQHTILKQLDQYLRDRVYALTQNKQPPQIPLIVPEPGWKYDRPLLPQFATQADIDTLKNQAFHAWIVEKNLDLASQLWELVNDLATDPQDKKLSRESLKAIDNRSTNSPSQPQNPATTSSEKSPLISHKPSQTPAISEDDLSSEKGIDYTKLRDLLRTQDWYAADEETYKVMIRAVGKEEGDYFDPEELLNFPCADLRTIDQLWVKYSKGHFGFSVQKQIYVECGAKLDGEYPGDKIWQKFGDRVGWRKDGAWLDYSDLNPSLSSPQGIFPTNRGMGGVVDCSSLAQRLVNCSTSQS